MTGRAEFIIHLVKRGFTFGRARARAWMTRRGGLRSAHIIMIKPTEKKCSSREWIKGNPRRLALAALRRVNILEVLTTVTPLDIEGLRHSIGIYDVAGWHCQEDEREGDRDHGMAVLQVSCRTWWMCNLPQKYSFRWGVFVARNPLKVIALCMLITALCGVALKFEFR